MEWDINIPDFQCDFSLYAILSQLNTLYTIAMSYQKHDVIARSRMSVSYRKGVSNFHFSKQKEQIDFVTGISCMKG